MTRQLQEALARLSALPSKQQNEIAALILDEIESESKWSESFAASQDALARLADEAIAEFERGETRPCD